MVLVLFLPSRSLFLYSFSFCGVIFGFIGSKNLPFFGLNRAKYCLRNGDMSMFILLSLIYELQQECDIAVIAFQKGTKRLHVVKTFNTINFLS